MPYRAIGLLAAIPLPMTANALALAKRGVAWNERHLRYNGSPLAASQMEWIKN